jgi:hypothetical protein
LTLSAFAVTEDHDGIGLDASLKRVANSPARQNPSATYGLVEAAKAASRLRQSRRIEYLIPDEILEHLKRTIQNLQVTNASTTSCSI